MAAAGAFPGVPAAAVTELAYWRLSGSTPPGEVHPLKTAAAELAEAALDGLRRLIATFDDARVPYRARPRPEVVPAYSDYAHLARVKEWSASGEDGGGEG